MLNIVVICDFFISCSCEVLLLALDSVISHLICGVQLEVKLGDTFLFANYMK